MPHLPWPPPAYLDHLPQPGSPVSWPWPRPQPAINTNRRWELGVVARGCLPVPTWPLSQDPACVSTHVLTHVRTYVSPHLFTGCPGGWFYPLLGGELGEVGDAGGSLFRGALSSLTSEDIVTWLLMVFSREPWGFDLVRAEDFGLLGYSER